MRSIVSLLFSSFGFYILLSIALYSVLKALSVQFNLTKLRVLAISLGFTTGYIFLGLTLGRVSGEAFRLLTYYMGAISFAFFLSLVYWAYYSVVSITGRRQLATNKVAGGVYVLATVATVSLSIYNFHKPASIETFTLQSDKISKPYTFLHLSDMQYGSISKEEMDQKLLDAYALNPDFIVFTGDLIDFDHYSAEDFNVLSQSPVPIYFERGNHEFYHDPTRLLSYLETIGPIKLLINDRVEVEELEIIGVDFSRRPNHLADTVDRLERDSEKFSILLYHEPRDVHDAVDRDFDLLLYGHTHGGQIWPFTEVVDWMYEFADGHFQIDDTFIYTSDGISLWGPRMRLGSQNEMVMFNLVPAEDRVVAKDEDTNSERTL